MYAPCVRLICSGATDVGSMRAHNEDAFWLSLSGGACAVIDGMGGQSSGTIASDAVLRAFDRHAQQSGPDAALESFVRDAMLAAHEAVIVTEPDKKRRAWGAAAVLLALRGDEIAIAHVGDCRAYRVRDRSVEQLTVDHSLVEEYARNASASRDQIEDVRARFRNVITRSLGFSEPLLVDTTLLEARRDDVFVLCCDGVWDTVARESMLSMIEQSATLELACAAIIAEANKGEDNNTVVLAKVVA